MPDAGKQPLEMRSDAELVRACNEGDESLRAAAVTVLYERYHVRLLWFARCQLKDPTVAEEAVQDTFEYLLRRIPPRGVGLHLRTKLTTKLYNVTKHNALAAARRAKKYEGCGLDPDELPSREPPDADAFEAILARLPPAQRETLRIRFVEDCPYSEIAARLRIPIGTVRSRIHHALKTLQRMAAAGELP